MRTYANEPIGTHPTGYHTGQYGPYKPARVVEFGSVLRQLTDRDSGDWRGGSFRARLSDPTHELQTALLAHVADGRGVLGRSYIVSRNGGKTGVDPRQWYAGPLLTWRPQRNSTVELEFGDQVAQVLGGVNEPDRRLPKRRFSLTDFPNLPKASLGLPVPIAYNYGSWTSAHNSGFPLVYVGPRLLNDGNTWHEWVVAGHALKEFTTLNLDFTTITTGWGSTWAMPGQTGWTTLTGGVSTYRTYNGRRYSSVFGRTGRTDPDAVANGEVRLTLEFLGIESSGSGSGALIQGAQQQILHCLVNWILGDYQSGSWLPIQDYATGWPQVDSSSFTTAAAIAAERVPGGYTHMHIYFGIRETTVGQVEAADVSIREALGWMSRSADTRLGLNQYHQWCAFMLPETVEEATLPVFGETIPARVLADSWDVPSGGHDGQFTRHVVDAALDPKLGAGTYYATEEYINETLETALNGRVDGPRLTLPFDSAVNPTTFQSSTEDVALRVLARHALPVREMTWATTRCGLSKTDLGELVYVQHHAAPGPCLIWIESVETALRHAIIRGWDVTGLVAVGSEGSP